MRKFMIIWFMFVFILGCSFKEEHKKDVLDNSYVITVSDEETVKKEIQKDLEYFLYKYNRNWNYINKKLFVEVVFAGQKEFNIDYRIVMSIISIESNYKIQARGRNKNSIDYGLTQQNSKYIDSRYKVAEIYLKKYNMKYSTSLYDISKNIFACYIYLKDLSDTPELLWFRDYISAYNQGIRGALRNNNNEYYNKFIKEFMEL
jgi:hypothetical protein